MTKSKKENLIKKHLGIATPNWIVQNCIKMLDEFNNMDDNVDKLGDQLQLYNVTNSLSNEVKSLLIESGYRLQQAIDIFNGSSGLNTTDEDKYKKMIECIDKIDKYLERD